MLARLRSLRARFASEQSGFTLLELLVTMLISIIGLTGLAAAFVTTARGNIDARHSAEAVAVGQGAIEQLKSMSIARIETTYATTITETPFTAAYHEGDFVGSLTYRRRIEAQQYPGQIDLVMLRVIVEWTDENLAAGTSGGIYDHRISLELMRSRQEGN